MIAIMFVILAFLVLAAYFGSSTGKTLSPYLCGRAIDENGRFCGSFGVYKEVKATNYYLEDYCGETMLIRPSWFISILLIVVMFAFAFLGVMV
jgi:ech hydrogenase subunit A